MSRPTFACWCMQCLAFHGDGRHLPEWHCWCLDWASEDEHPTVVHAIDAKFAAERFVNDYDEVHEHAGQRVLVLVKSPDGAERSTYSVGVEAILSVSAREATPADLLEFRS